MKKRYLILAVLFICAALLCSCDPVVETGDNEEIIVTYYEYDGEGRAYLCEAPVYNGCIAFASLPVREGYDFLGLFDAEEGGVMYLDPNGVSSIEITRSLMLYARWEAQKYTLRFDAGEGVLPDGEAERKIPYGSTLTELPSPVREGYAFVGWCDAWGTRYSEGSRVLEDRQSFTSATYPFDEKCVTLHAAYEEIYPAVTFSWDDGSLRATQVKVAYGATVAPEDFPREDTGSREIVGWTEVQGSTVPFTGNVWNDMTLYPIWQDYRTVIFNDSLGGREEIRLYRDTVIDLETYGDDTRDGFIVEGWYVSSSYSGNPLTSLTYGGGVEELFAKWERATYTLTFDEESAGASFPPITYSYGDFMDLPEVRRLGYRFLGWYNNAELSGSPRKFWSAKSFGSYTLYAGFEKLHYRVELDARGGTVSYPVRYFYGDEFPLEVPVRNGYTFLGWYTAAEGGEQFTDETGTPVEGAFVEDSVLSLYARWEAQTFTLTFDAESAGASYPSVSYTAGDTFSLPTPERSDCVFLGWYTDAECTGDAMTYVPSTLYGNHVLYAGFERIHYRIFLHAEGGMLSSDVKEVRLGEEFTLEVPEREGYSFFGWYTAADENGLIFADERGRPIQGTFSQKNDLHLYAHWAVRHDSVC